MNGTLLQTLTGSIGVGNSFNSSGRDLYIHFTSDNESSSNLGFTIQYEAGKYLVNSINKKAEFNLGVGISSPRRTNVSFLFVVLNLNDPCGPRKPFVGTVEVGIEVEIRSPGYPSNYANSLDCQWVINVDKGLGVQINFTFFDLEAG